MNLTGVLPYKGSDAAGKHIDDRLTNLRMCFDIADYAAERGQIIVYGHLRLRTRRADREAIRAIVSKDTVVLSLACDMIPDPVRTAILRQFVHKGLKPAVSGRDSLAADDEDMTYLGRSVCVS